MLCQVRRRSIPSGRLMDSAAAVGSAVAVLCTGTLGSAFKIEGQIKEEVTAARAVQCYTLHAGKQAGPMSMHQAEYEVKCASKTVACIYSTIAECNKAP